MPKKSHIGYTRLSKKNLDNYLKGRLITIKPLDQEDEDNTVVKLQYKAKKNLTKLNKNLSMGKGVRVNPDELEDMEIHSGNGLFDSLKKITSNPIAKTVLKAAMPIASNLVSQQVKNLTGSDALANVSKNLMKEGTNELTSGSGFNFNDILKSRVTKGIIKAAMPIASNLVSQQVKNLTGSDALAGVSKNLMNEGSKELVGSGFRGKRGGSALPLGGSINPNQFVGISYNSPDFSNPSERMAYVRSHRRSNGVVM